MLLVAAILTILVGLMHSVLGGKYLINPLLAREGFPVLLGSVKNAKLTLWIGWHMLSFIWWGLALELLVIHFASEYAAPAFLWILSGLFAASGLVALIFSKGKHRSYFFFLPVAVLTALAALNFSA